ncbi:MAG: hypothetical protein ACFFD4_38770, partial [Candidatus Odinarchaeota archaeon]
KVIEIIVAGQPLLDLFNRNVLEQSQDSNRVSSSHREGSSRCQLNFLAFFSQIPTTLGIRSP